MKAGFMNDATAPSAAEVRAAELVILKAKLAALEELAALRAELAEEAA